MYAYLYVKKDTQIHQLCNVVLRKKINKKRLTNFEIYVHL